MPSPANTATFFIPRPLGHFKIQRLLFRYLKPLLTTKSAKYAKVFSYSGVEAED
jgi:hypothetical protein